MSGNREYKSDVFSMLIPTPHFAVFYNGDEEQPERYEQKLSNLFEKPTETPELELVCTVYNINNGKNKELLAECPFLKEYMTFVTYVRENHRDNRYEDLRDAIEEAIDRCIKEGILREFLIARRSEVVKAMTLDYTFDRQIELEREDSRAEGRAEGRREGLAEGRREGLTEGRREGMESGRLAGKIESVLYLLERIGTVPEEIRQTIQSVTDMGVLESWLDLAVRSGSMEEFIREMTGKDR